MGSPRTVVLRLMLDVGESLSVVEILDGLRSGVGG